MFLFPDLQSLLHCPVNIPRSLHCPANILDVLPFLLHRLLAMPPIFILLVVLCQLQFALQCPAFQLDLLPQSFLPILFHNFL